MTDQASAEDFVRRLGADHGAEVFRWARGRFADHRDAEEVVAETLAKAWRYHDQFDPERGSERSWLFGIARNTAVDQHRRSRRHLSPVPSDGVPEPIQPDSVEQIVASSVIRDAIAGLTEPHRAVLAAVHFGGLTIAEAADRLGIPEGTVKSRLYYALKGLRSGLEERGFFP